jgi:hypothetical protein
MNTLELLYNKALMKAASSQDGQIKKTKVWGHLTEILKKPTDSLHTLF